MIDVTLACEDAKSKFVEVVTVADVDVGKRVDDSLVQIWKLKFCHITKFLSSPRFDHYFEGGIHIITSLSLSICGVCESHKFPIICPLWVLNELTSIVDKMQHD